MKKFVVTLTNCYDPRFIIRRTVSERNEKEAEAAALVRVTGETGQPAGNWETTKIEVVRWLPQ